MPSSDSVTWPPSLQYVKQEALFKVNEGIATISMYAADIDNVFEIYVVNTVVEGEGDEAVTFDNYYMILCPFYNF